MSVTGGGLAERGLDFADALEVFAGPLLENLDSRFDYATIVGSLSATCVSEWSWLFGHGTARIARLSH